MALDPKIVKMLNDYADSQPALRLPTEPAGSSNPQLGTALDAALDSAAAYSAGTPADWDTSAPETTKDAIDRLASAVAGLLAGPVP